MQTKRIWFLIVGLAVLFGALLITLAWAQTKTHDAVVPVGLSESDVTQLAKDALKIEYTGAPVQVEVTRTTTGELHKFDCGRIGAMISVVVSPLQGKPDVCAADSTMWVVLLRGEFQREGFATDSVQIVLDRAGRLMSMDSGELVSTAGY